MNSDDILWVFCNENPGGIASNIVNGILPAKKLGIRMIIFLNHFDPIKTLDKFKPKLIVLGKVIGNPSGVLSLIKEAKSRNIKVLIPLPDWNLSNEDDWNLQQNKIKLILAQNVDKVILQTKAASDYIKKNLNIESEIIPDCIRFTHNESIKKIREPLEIVWFGNSTNHDTLLDYGLLELYSSNLKLNLKVITTFKDRILINVDKKFLNRINLNCIEWKPDMDKEVIKSDIVIIPYPNDKKRIVKTQNRITDSMSMGRFVITSDMPFTREFKDYCFIGDLGKGVAWVLENKPLAIKKAKLGKGYVDQNFSILNISEMWRDLFVKYLK